MRNICLSDFESRQFYNLHDCEVFCYNRHCLIACDKGIIIKSQGSNEEVICDLKENLYSLTKIPKALEVNYCSEKNLLWIIFINGDIVSLDINESNSETIYGTIDSGIKAAKWSPDEEVIALISGNETVVVMTNDFDLVSEVNLHGSGFGEKQFITVGWGKKETQFRGSEGKFSAKNKKIENVDLFVENNDKVKISWRGDAEYFAVSSINPETFQRYFRIFNKSGILQYTSENLNGLEHCLDWRPSGNLITSTQRFPNKYSVCFFEKNGLKHGEFILPFSHDTINVEEVLWNKDSKLLALLIVKVLKVSHENVNVYKNKYIQLYAVNNYHWYCKYTIDFDSKATPLFMQWNLQKYNSLHVILKRGNQIYHNKYSWLWVTNKSKGSSLNDESYVAVIDGCNLQLTSFKKGIIPPPMYSYIFQMPLPINLVSFAPDDGLLLSNDFFVQLSDGSLLIYKFLNSDCKELSHKLIGKISGFNMDFELCYNIQWAAPKIFMFCCIKINEKESKPFLNKIEIENFDSTITFKRKEIPLQSTIAILKPSSSGVVIYENNGGLNFFDSSNNELITLYSNENRSFIDLEVTNNEDGNLTVLSLDNLNKFYINNNIIFSNVLSYHIHGKIVLLTTMKNELLCLNVNKKILINSDISDICKRRIERGSRLVTSVHKNMKVILQMPRGNLECVQPRVLSLFALGKYLDSSNYYKAFDLMLKQRINLNLLYDHDPISFSKNLNVFIDQIKDLQWLSFFFSELINEDVSQTMYSDFYKTKGIEKNKIEKKSKIDIICDMFEKELSLKNDSEKYLLPILSCCIKRRNIESLETALLKLKNLKEKELKGMKTLVSFDEAFKYVLYLIDVEELYKTALGMYDFDLVLIIASKSQKDPKEYLSFLNDLKKLEPNYQKFKIDKYLKRFEKALTNLVLCDGNDAFSECLSFIKTHNLYKFALKLIPQNTDRYKNVCISYAEELIRSQLFEEAGIMYSNAGMYLNAIEAYRKSKNWQEVLLLCERELKLTEEDQKQFYLDLAIEMNDLKHFKEAAVIYLDYVRDIEECVRTLSNGKLYAEAYRVCYLHHRNDLTNTIILPIIVEQGNLMKLQITKFSETFIKQKNRLQVVRKQKLEIAEKKSVFDGDDLYSESSTIITDSYASRTTNRSYRSAKNKRKHERKLLSLKEGSPYEDIALITSLHNLVTNCIELKLEIKNLNTFLIKIKEQKQAENLQKQLDDLLTIIEQAKWEIWTPDLLNNRQYYGADATSNEIAAMYMKAENVAPVLLHPKFAIAPETQSNVKWQLEILKP